MSKLKLLRKKTHVSSVSQCYNCGIEIATGVSKRCPNCKMILDPNNYIDWRYSFYGFLCVLCLIPLIITILFIMSHL